MMANATMTVEVRVYGAALLCTLLPALTLLPETIAVTIFTFLVRWLVWAKVGKHFVRLAPRYEVEL